MILLSSFVFSPPCLRASFFSSSFTTQKRHNSRGHTPSTSHGKLSIESDRTPEEVERDETAGMTREERTRYLLDLFSEDPEPDSFQPLPRHRRRREVRHRPIRRDEQGDEEDLDVLAAKWSQSTFAPRRRPRAWASRGEKTEMSDLEAELLLERFMRDPGPSMRSDRGPTRGYDYPAAASASSLNFGAPRSIVLQGRAMGLDLAGMPEDEAAEVLATAKRLSDTLPEDEPVNRAVPSAAAAAREIDAVGHPERRVSAVGSSAVTCPKEAGTVKAPAPLEGDFKIILQSGDGAEQVEILKSVGVQSNLVANLAGGPLSLFCL